MSYYEIPSVPMVGSPLTLGMSLSNDGRAERKRNEIEQRCKDKKAEALNRQKEQLIQRNYQLRGNDARSANVMLLAAQVMREEKELIQNLTAELELLRNQLRNCSCMTQSKYEHPTGGSRRF
ncbi:hypothetical protein SISNIDRAFT_469756 [Sistotremastrum niveocremeum HHB9708]|uniref:Uncharacterized protein n=1 Tax=Sistotremastrum niveocremeum HHB9708 TaxID=1314777 RepID=A0A164PM85_9AGAM|nr:hypothetical protein SISNIDRAFT_469756 [Sistotremastrum niveocremeum HHB9708]